MTGAVVIALGNTFRRDDGVGPAVAAEVERLGLPGVRVVCAAETTAILDAWEGAEVAVVVDAAAGGEPGAVRRCRVDEVAQETPVSSHGLSLAQTFELGTTLGRAPASLVVVAVGVCDTGHGVGLSPAVGAALPEAVRVVRSVVEQAQEPRHQQP